MERQHSLFDTIVPPSSKPFKLQLLKWIGNKQKFAHEIISYFPSELPAYYEPFLGSGAVLGTLAPKLVPQITIVRPPRPDYLQIVHSLPIFHSKSPGAARWRPSPDGRCRSNEMVERTCG